MGDMIKLFKLNIWLLNYFLLASESSINMSIKDLNLKLS